MFTQRFSFRDDPDVPSFDDTAPVAVMDAGCALCTWGARVIHRLDRSGTVRICPVQSPLGAALMRHYGLDPDDPSTWLFIDDGQAFTDFKATLHAGRRFGGWAVLANLLLVFGAGSRFALRVAGPQPPPPVRARRSVRAA